MTRVAVALGSNLGDRLGYLRIGAAGISELGEAVDVSRVFETEPVGGPDQGRFLNAVITLETSVEPSDLLEHLLAVEKRASRTRDVRWGPRTLDLDLIVYGDQQIDEPKLQVPHPRAHERGFVIAPLVDVWPEAVMAEGSTARDALGVVGVRGLTAWEGDWRVAAPGLGWRATAWVAGQLVLFAVWLGALLATPTEFVQSARSWLGWSVALLGLGVLEASRRSLGKELTPFPQPRQGGQLVDTGVYGYVRHPIYLAVLLMFGGVSLAVGSLPAGLVTLILLGFFSAKASVEERALGIGIPGYTDYRDRVGFRMLPYVW